MSPTKNILFLLAIAAAAVARAESPTNGVNAATIYAPVFSNIDAWAEAHPGFGRAPTNVFSPEAAQAYADLQPQLDAMNAAENATFVDWGTHFEQGAAALLPYVQPAMKAMRAANWAAAYALSNNLPGFADDTLEAMRVARNVGEDRLLICLLVQIAGEKPAADLLAQHLDKLDAKQLGALEQKLSALPPGTTAVEAMQMEKAMMVDNLIKQLLEAMRDADTNLFEAIAADANATNSTRSTANSAPPNPPSWLTENLRLTSIVDSGKGYKIGFETRDGDSFLLALGRPHRGIEMLSVDYTREEAIIARSNETAVVKLKSREISPLHLRLRMPTPEQVKNPMSLVGGSATDSMRLKLQYYTVLAEIGQKTILDGSGGNAEGLMALLNKTSAEYGEWIAAFQRLPLDKFRDWQKDFMKTATPVTQAMLPAIERVAEKEQTLLASRAKLAAAIASRRADLEK